MKLIAQLACHTQQPTTKRPCLKQGRRWRPVPEAALWPPHTHCGKPTPRVTPQTGTHVRVHHTHSTFFSNLFVKRFLSICYHLGISKARAKSILILSYVLSPSLSWFLVSKLVLRCVDSKLPSNLRVLTTWKHTSGSFLTLLLLF